MVSNRVETGLIKFEGDWTAVVIRGDSALHYRNYLGRLLDRLSSKDESHPFLFPLEEIYLKSLLNLLASSNENSPDHNSSEVQRLKNFEQCVVEEPNDKPIAG